MTLQNLSRRSDEFGEDLSRMAAIFTIAGQHGVEVDEGTCTNLLGVDEIPMLQTCLQALGRPGPSRVCLHPSKAQDTEALGIVQVPLEVTAGPFVELDGLEVLHDGVLPDEVVDDEDNGALLAGAL